MTFVFHDILSFICCSVSLQPVFHMLHCFPAARLLCCAITACPSCAVSSTCLPVAAAGNASLRHTTVSCHFPSVTQGRITPFQNHCQLPTLRMPPLRQPATHVPCRTVSCKAVPCTSQRAMHSAHRFPGYPQGRIPRYPQGRIPQGRIHDIHRGGFCCELHTCLHMRYIRHIQPFKGRLCTSAHALHTWSAHMVCTGSL